MASPTTESDPFVGTVVADRYRVVRLLGRGGMGAVYEAEHVTIGRRVAIKKLVSHLSGDSEVYARFRREAEVIAGFQHPGIVGVLDWVTLDDGSPCIVMDYLKGEDLAARIASRGPLAWPELARIADEVLSALSVAHEAGIVHRDLKPQNIFLAVDDEGRESAKLLDFGVSKIQASATLATPGSQIIGTPAYMAPEQARGKSRDVDDATDIWAMGVVLFEMAAGVLPFDGDSVPGMLYQICHEPPEALGEHRIDAPAALVRAVQGCLERDMRARTSSAKVLREQICGALTDLAPRSFRAPVGKPAAARGRARARPTTGTMTTLAAPVTADDPKAPTSPGNGAPGVTTTLSASSGAIEIPSRLRSSALAVPALLLCLALGALGIGFAVWPSGLGDLADPPEVERAQSTRPAPPPQKTPPEPAASASPSDEAAPTAITMVIDSEPSDANVFDHNNRYLGITPLTYKANPGQKALSITLRKPGYEDHRAELTIVPGKSEAVTLARKSRKSRKSRNPEPQPKLEPSADKPEEPEEKKPLRGPYVEDL